MSIKGTEQLISSGQLGQVVGVAEDVGSGVGHDDRG